MMVCNVPTARVMAATITVLLPLDVDGGAHSRYSDIGLSRRGGFGVLLTAARMLCTLDRRPIRP